MFQISAEQSDSSIYWFYCVQNQAEFSQCDLTRGRSTGMAKYDFYFVTYAITYVKKYNDEIYYLSNEKKKEKTYSGGGKTTMPSLCR